MAADTKPDMTDQSHRVYGSRAVGALVPAIARPAFRKRGPAAAQIMADWPAIVGPALAATTVPRRLSGGRLTLACAGPVAMELQHLAPELIARINAHVGHALVTELRFAQDHILAAALPESRPKPPSAQTVAAVQKKVSALPAGPLRDALEALGQSVHSSRPSPSSGLSTHRPRGS